MKQSVPFRMLCSLPLILLILFSCKENKDIKPERKDIIDAVFASGVLFYEDEYNVVSNSNGYLDKVYKREGDSVRSGECIYVISNDVAKSQVDIAKFNYKDAITKVAPHSATLKQVEEQVTLSEKQMMKDSIDYERNKRLYALKSISTLDYENAEIQYQTSKTNYIVQRNLLETTLENLKLARDNAKKQLDIQHQANNYNMLYAAIDGVLAQLLVNSGDLVTVGMPIAKITGGNLKVKLYIDEGDINRVKYGDTVLVSLNTMPEKNIVAILDKIYPNFDNQDQAFVAEAGFIKLPEDIYLFSQTQLQANIIVGEHKNALVIPIAYINNGEVFPKDKKLGVKVQLGIVSDNWVEIVSGIDDNT
ncbi:MAG: efflux RND transporter periplasmic adaptor subunit, partial [Tannerellaceae bacterium]